MGQSWTWKPPALWTQGWAGEAPPPFPVSPSPALGTLPVPRQGPRSLTITSLCAAPIIIVDDGGLGVIQAEPQR